MMTLQWLPYHMNLHLQSPWIISISLAHVSSLKTEFFATLNAPNKHLRQSSEALKLRRALSSSFRYWHSTSSSYSYAVKMSLHKKVFP